MADGQVRKGRAHVATGGEPAWEGVAQRLMAGEVWEVVICGPLPPVVNCQQERLYLLFYRDCSVLAIRWMGCEAQQPSPVEEVGKV
jgi:hypothetical protein